MLPHGGTIGLSHIHVNPRGYAEVYSPQRVNGKKVNDPVYLGKVINLEEGIFYSRQRGYFRYTTEDGFDDCNSLAPADQEKMILDFGPAFLLDNLLRGESYFELFSGILKKKQDSLMALLFYRILEKGGYYLAEDWLAGSYASILFPKAQLQSQQVNELLRELGEESVVRAFFIKYLKMAVPQDRRAGVLIDSAGLPNNVDFRLSAPFNHGGDKNNEARLILAVDKLTKKPLFFRYNAGSISDIATLLAAKDELRIMNVDIGMIILDTGYPSDDAIDELFEEEMPFLTRLKPNRKLFKSLVGAYWKDALDDSNIVRYPGRLVGIIRKEIRLTDKHNGFAYIAVDHDQRHLEWKAFTREALDDGLSVEERRENTAAQGFFVLVSSEAIDTQDVLPLYYARQAVEQIFDVDKNDLTLLPIRVHIEETLRGHLMLVFLASVAHLLLVEKLQQSKYSAAQALSIFRNLKCKVYGKTILVKAPVNAPVKKMNDICKALRISIPAKVEEGKEGGI